MHPNFLCMASFVVLSALLLLQAAAGKAAEGPAAHALPLSLVSQRKLQINSLREGATEQGATSAPFKYTWGDDDIYVSTEGDEERSALAKVRNQYRVRAALASCDDL